MPTQILKPSSVRRDAQQSARLNTFTSVNWAPVGWIAKNASPGMVQVVLQGIGQGFVSAGVPGVTNIAVQILAYRLEHFYGLVLLACASQACTGWQAGKVPRDEGAVTHDTGETEYMKAPEVIAPAFRLLSRTLPD